MIANNSRIRKATTSNSPYFSLPETVNSSTVLSPFGSAHPSNGLFFLPDQEKLAVQPVVRCERIIARAPQLCRVRTGLRWCSLQQEQGEEAYVGQSGEEKDEAESPVAAGAYLQRVQPREPREHGRGAGEGRE